MWAWSQSHKHRSDSHYISLPWKSALGPSGTPGAVVSDPKPQCALNAVLASASPQWDDVPEPWNGAISPALAELNVCVDLFSNLPCLVGVRPREASLFSVLWFVSGVSRLWGSCSSSSSSIRRTKAAFKYRYKQRQSVSTPQRRKITRLSIGQRYMKSHGHFIAVCVLDIFLDSRIYYSKRNRNLM